MDNKATVKRSSYLTFSIGDEIFAAHVAHVIKILEMVPVTTIPHTPIFVKGIINHSGGVLPVVDARLKLGFDEQAYDINTCIVVLEIPGDGEAEQVGIIVDAARQVIEIRDDQIKGPPAFGKKYELPFIKGIIPRDDDFMILLNIQEFFTQDERTSFNEIKGTKPKSQ
jgi:purine-binding chemotaxis protein CheW